MRCGRVQVSSGPAAPVQLDITAGRKSFTCDNARIPTCHAINMYVHEVWHASHQIPSWEDILGT